MNKNEPQSVSRQYRIELTLNSQLTGQEAATVTINAASEGTAKQLVQRMIGPETKFINRESGGFDIVHPKVLNGEQPFGWAAPIAVPARFGVQSATDYRLSEHRAA